MSDDKGQLDELPGTVEGMFAGYYQFDPISTVTFDDILEILKVMQIRFGEEHFNKLSPEAKKQFSFIGRDGKPVRYGRKPRGW